MPNGLFVTEEEARLRREKRLRVAKEAIPKVTGIVKKGLPGFVPSPYYKEEAAPKAVPTAPKEVRDMTLPVTTPTPEVVTPLVSGEVPEYMKQAFEYVDVGGKGVPPIGEERAEGKIYREEDIPTQAELTRGGFGYVPTRGLPEAGATPESYYREVIGKLLERSEKLALDIESGFAKGRRLTGATAELQAIIETMPLLLAGVSGIGITREAEAAELEKVKAETEKIRKETGALPATLEERMELEAAKRKGLEMTDDKNREIAKLEAERYYITEEEYMERKQEIEKRYWKEFGIAPSGGYISPETKLVRTPSGRYGIYE